MNEFAKGEYTVKTNIAQYVHIWEIDSTGLSYRKKLLLIN